MKGLGKRRGLIHSLDNFFPGYLIRDNAAQCLAVADDLYYWSQDEFLHKLDSMHQLALYNFLEFVAEYQQDMGEAVAVFYQGRSLSGLLMICGNR